MHRSCAPFVITTIKNSCHCYSKFLPLAVSELLLGSSELDLEQQFLYSVLKTKILVEVEKTDWGISDAFL